LATVRVPRRFNHRSPQERRDLASTLRTLDLPPAPDRGRQQPALEDERIDALRAAIRAHPCHDCPDREAHARWSERYHRLARQTAALRRRIEGRTTSLARPFDHICALPDTRVYPARDRTPPAGPQP